MSAFTVSTFYKFFAVEQPSALQADLQSAGVPLEIHGLVLIAPEGINGTIAGTPEAITQYKNILEEHCGDLLFFKDSPANAQPFKRWHVKIREEIVGLKRPDIVPKREDTHLAPADWHKLMQEEDVVLLDTRNDYETRIGKFRGAIDPKLKQFSQFPEYVKKSGIPKEKKVLMYCTGGIRCEKAIYAMKEQGYQHVYQLDGGILKYIEEYPDGAFEGECFVFDHRTAVDCSLQPSTRYVSCPHCGDPGDLHIECTFCQSPGVICPDCRQHEHRQTCSKQCAYRRSNQLVKT